MCAFTSTYDVSALLQREQHFRNLRKHYPSIVEILGGDWLFKVNRLNTKSYVLEFGVSSEGIEQSPMVIEG